MSAPLFGYGGEQHSRKGRPTLKRDRGSEQWAEAILPADAEAGAIETPTSRRPLWIVAGLVAVAVALLATQLFQLQIVNGQRNLGLAEGNRLREKITRAPRGVIYDRNKQVVAQNLASFDVTVVPTLLPQDEAKRRELYQKVAAGLNLSAEEIAAKAETDCVKSATTGKVTKERATFECLASTQPRLVATNVARDVALGFDQATTATPGFSLDVNPIRQYQDGGQLSAIMGYTGRVNEQELTGDRTYVSTDFIGKLGIEKQYESVLRGRNGREQIEVDAAGRPVKVLAAQAAEPGSNVMLTIDNELQAKLRENMTKQMQASGSTQAAGIAISPKTGEILAAVNMPTYDNNLFARGISQNDYSKLTKDPAQPLFNKVMAGAYPTGSIIKPLIGSAALQEKAITTETTVNDTGQIEVTNRYDKNVKYTFRSYEPGGVGIVNITRAIAQSSNVFFYTVGGGYGNIGGLGHERLIDYYKKFGLGEKTGIDIPEETAGLLPTPDWKKKLSGEDWVLGDTYNIAVGQGDLKASPLQMAVAESAVANGGKILKPRLLKEVQGPGGQTTETPKTEVLREGFISPENLKVIQGGMREVITRGSACCQFDKQVPVHVAGKTGTAETDPSGNRKPHAWFVGYAPYEDPQILFVVLVQNSGEGAQFAAPIVRETLAWCFTRPGGCVK